MSNQTTLKTGEAIPQARILVKYDGKTFGPYPNDKKQLTIDIVQRELAKQFPEAAKCEIGQKVLDDGSLELTFTKKGVTKGATLYRYPYSTPADEWLDENDAEIGTVRAHLQQHLGVPFDEVHYRADIGEGGMVVYQDQQLEVSRIVTLVRLPGRIVPVEGLKGGLLMRGEQK
jgi:hypothetical protein